ncbi:MAG: hypothetical protein NVSMB12_11080 [Acidimicrobiales bacterium]
MAQHLDLAAHDAEQPGTHAQERGLSGAVGALHEDDLASRHVEVGAGQRGERPKEGNGRAQVKCNTAGHGREGTGHLGGLTM